MNSHEFCIDLVKTRKYLLSIGSMRHLVGVCHEVQVAPECTWLKGGRITSPSTGDKTGWMHNGGTITKTLLCRTHCVIQLYQYPITVALYATREDVLGNV